MSVLQGKYGGACPVSARDLYNFSAGIISRKLGGRSPIQALIDEVDSTVQSDVISERLIDAKNQISHLLLFN